MRSIVALLVVAALAGCGDATVAFCSGGDDFCDDFFLRLGGDDGDDEKEEEPEPDEEVEPAADGALQAALKVSRLTPGSIEAALVQERMETLAAGQPDLVGLWLIEGTLGRMWDGNDNVATTRFLDQVRAWLAVAAREMEADGRVLAAAFELFAEFAADLDPASAEVAAIRASLLDSGVPGNTAAAMFVERAAQIVEVAAQAPEDCCAAADLASAALLLCSAFAEQRALETRGVGACGQVRVWFAEFAGDQTGGAP